MCPGVSADVSQLEMTLSNVWNEIDKASMFHAFSISPLALFNGEFTPLFERCRFHVFSIVKGIPHQGATYMIYYDSGNYLSTRSPSMPISLDYFDQYID
jgi:hypothetical protein